MPRLTAMRPGFSGPPLPGAASQAGVPAPPLALRGGDGSSLTAFLPEPLLS